MKKYTIVFASLLAALVIGVSPATVKAQVNNDMVLGFLMGFAQNNTVQSGNFIGALTGTALGGSVNSTGGTVTNVGNIVGSGGLTGGLLGGALSGSLNATGINGLQAINTSGANAVNSIGTGFLLGQTMAGLNTNLATQGLSLASIAPMTIPGLNGITGGVGTNTSIGAIVTSLMGQSATANAITGLMNGGLLGNTLGGVTGGMQAGAANLLLNSLGLGTGGNNMGLSNVGQMAMASILNGTSGISGLSGLASLNMLNAGSGNGLLGALLSGGTNVTGSAASSLLASLGSGSLFGSLGGLTNPSNLFGNGQAMMQNASAVAQNLLGGNFLGAAIQNAIGSAVGSALGQTVNNALGSGLSNLLGMATGALSSIGQALTGALGSLSNAVSGLLGNATNAATNAVTNAATNAVTNATNSFSNSLAGMLNCNSGTPSTTGTNPTNPRPNVPTPTGGGQCGSPTSGWTEDQCRQAAQIAATDNAPLKYCARGVANILEGMGMGSAGRGVNGDGMGAALGGAGWNRQNCPPSQAPNGAVLTYGNSGATTGNGGARFGHAEIKCTINGQTVYISDTVRSTPGGSVPQNYEGAWVR